MARAKKRLCFGLADDSCRKRLQVFRAHSVAGKKEDDPVALCLFHAGRESPQRRSVARARLRDPVRDALRNRAGRVGLLPGAGEDHLEPAVGLRDQGIQRLSKEVPVVVVRHDDADLRPVGMQRPRDRLHEGLELRNDPSRRSGRRGRGLAGG